MGGLWLFWGRQDRAFVKDLYYHRGKQYRGNAYALEKANAFAHECRGKKDREDWFQATGHDGPGGIQIFKSAEVEK